MRRAAWILVAVAVVAVLVIGLTQASDDVPTAPQDQFDSAQALEGLKGAPAPLAALHRQANEILDGGVPALQARLKALRGHPVVINKWGSWCTPCRAEFPVFQRVAARKGRTVAFLGIDGGDNRDAAEEFLREHPVSYPSYFDPDEKLARTVQAPANYPMTVFIDRHGEIVFPHAGPYRTVAELEADIKRYLDA
jgi:cytochrome c biogenesis protein CcmG, thiol:disulfide interchange protein DsbE